MKKELLRKLNKVLEKDPDILFAYLKTRIGSSGMIEFPFEGHARNP